MKQYHYIIILAILGIVVGVVIAKIMSANISEKTDDETKDDVITDSTDGAIPEVQAKSICRDIKKKSMELKKDPSNLDLFRELNDIKTDLMRKGWACNRQNGVVIRFK